MKKRLTKQTFREIKERLNSNVDRLVIRKIFNMAYSTISRISSSRSFNQYKEHQKLESKRFRDKRKSKLSDPFPVSFINEDLEFVSAVKTIIRFIKGLK